VCACVRVFVCLCVRACVSVSLCLCLRVRVRVRVHLCLCASECLCARVRCVRAMRLHQHSAQALLKKASHVPYRDSKLTHMLSDSLGGESKCGAP
jgi:hypothetical protein